MTHALAGEATAPAKLSQLAVAVPFGPGDSMLLYTDGISEARDRSGAFYQLERRGARIVGTGPGHRARHALRRGAASRGGHLHDDSAALLITRQKE